MRMITILATVFSFTSAFAGEITLSGSGHVSHQPELVKMVVNVEARCFKSAKDAESVVGGMTTQIVNVLKRDAYKKHEEYKKPTPKIGNTLQDMNETVYTNGAQAKNPCFENWTAGYTISMTTGIDNNDLTGMRNEMADLLDKNSNKEFPKLNAGERVNFRLSTFMPSLSEKTAKELKLKANAMAYNDALAQLKEAVNRCNYKNVEMDKEAYSSAQPYSPRSNYEMGFKADGAQASGRTANVLPASFNDEEVTSSYTATYKYKAAEINCKAN